MVVDASVAAAWFLPDEQSLYADGVMAEIAKTRGHVPSLFWFEMRNLFLMAERRGRFEKGEALSSMAQLRRLSLTDEGTGSDAVILALASKHALSAYDASYLALAIALARPLVTLDRQLAAAALAEKVRSSGSPP